MLPVKVGRVNSLFHRVKKNWLWRQAVAGRLQQAKKIPGFKTSRGYKRLFDRDLFAHPLRLFGFWYPHFENTVFEVCLGLLNVNPLRKFETP